MLAVALDTTPDKVGVELFGAGWLVASFVVAPATTPGCGDVVDVSLVPPSKTAVKRFTVTSPAAGCWVELLSPLSTEALTPLIQLLRFVLGSGIGGFLVESRVCLLRMTGTPLDSGGG